jgi:chemotaxis protein CheX
MPSVSLEEIASYFTQSLSQALSTMAGFEINSISCNKENLSILKPSIMGSMILHGERIAVVSLAMEYNTALMIMAYMTGILPEELEEQDLFDGVAELVNIMAGEVKAKLSNTPNHFTLTSPFSLEGQNLRIIYKHNIPRVCKRLMAGEMEIIFEFAYI